MRNSDVSQAPGVGGSEKRLVVSPAGVEEVARSWGQIPALIKDREERQG